VASGKLRGILDQLIPIESRYFEFWQDFFDLHVNTLDLVRRLKLVLLLAVGRLFGTPAIHIVLEAIEIHGVRKYLRVWSAPARGAPCSLDRHSHTDEAIRIDDEPARNLDSNGALFISIHFANS
jgi:hypothetical protein